MDLVFEIKKKKEFRNLDDSFVEDALRKIAKENQLDISKDEEIIVKKTRAFLREVYGAFLSKNFDKRDKLLSSLAGLNDLEGHRKILKLHISTAERIPYYNQVYASIFAITGNPGSILDIASGLNPLSYPFMNIKAKYFAYELSKDDALFLQKYFDKMRISGETLFGDITKSEEMERLPQADICFLFKAIDTLESIRWNVTGELFSKLKCKWIVASFPLRTLGKGKLISEKRLSWFLKLINGMKYERIIIGDEVFFILRKA